MLDGIIITMPALVKASTSGDKRIVEVEASNESMDSEGDVILQRALLDSSASFVKSGHLDIDHLSEIGERLGIDNPSGYIIGRPVEVKDLGKGRTGVVGEIRRSKDGKVSAKSNKYDEFWESLQSDPPVQWSASIYGFPISGQIDDCRTGTCDVDATRFLVKGLDWRSLAFTRNPINTAIKGMARIVTAKSRIELIKSTGIVKASGGAYAGMPLSWPRNMDELWGQYSRHNASCPHSEGTNSVLGFTNHFLYCCGMMTSDAELFAHALMYAILLDRKKRSD